MSENNDIGDVVKRLDDRRRAELALGETESELKLSRTDLLESEEAGETGGLSKLRKKIGMLTDEKELHEVKVERAEADLQKALDAYLINFEKMIPELQQQIDDERARLEERLAAAAGELQLCVDQLGMRRARDVLKCLFPQPAWDEGRPPADPEGRRVYAATASAIKQARGDAGSRPLTERLSELRGVKLAFKQNPRGARALRLRVLNRARETLEGVEDGDK